MASIRTSIARVAAAKQAWAPSVRTFASTSPIAQAAAPDSYPGPYAEPSNGRPLNRYLIVVEDYNDAGALARRMEVRERHLEHAQIGKAVGRIELGGALLKRDHSEISEEGPGSSMMGSAMIVLGESIEDVHSRLAQDEYTRGAVWDLSKLRVYPFVQALCTPQPTVSALDTASPSVTPGTTATRAPFGNSAVQTSSSPRMEVHHVDPVMPSTASQHRAQPSPSLRQLRKDMEQGGGHRSVTLDALRKAQTTGQGDASP